MKLDILFCLWLASTAYCLAILLVRFTKDRHDLGNNKKTELFGILISLSMILVPAVVLLIISFYSAQNLSEIVFITGTASMLLGIAGGCPFLGRAVYRAVYNKMDQKL